MFRGNDVKLVVQQADGNPEALIGVADQVPEILKFLHNLQARVLPFIINVIQLLQFVVDDIGILTFRQDEKLCPSGGLRRVIVKT